MLKDTHTCKDAAFTQKTATSRSCTVCETGGHYHAVPQRRGKVNRERHKAQPFMVGHFRNQDIYGQAYE